MDEDNTYLAELYKALNYSQTEFDKSLTYISSGVLAVSYVFIDKVVVLKDASFKTLLIQGWVIISVAIATSLLAHGVSIFFIYQSITYNDDDVKLNQIQKSSRITIGIMNMCTLVLLLIGAINIFNFIKANI